MAIEQRISGYRDLSEADIALINKIKEEGLALRALIDTVDNVAAVDRRWLAIGRTHLQEGLMAVVRAIARPEGF